MPFIAPHPPILDLAFEVDVNARPGESLGTVFELEAGSTRCAAGFVNSMQSRIYANQNDLEFWCREREGEPLVFKSIGTPSPTQFTSSIANIGGRLFEYVSQSYYEDGAWRPMSEAERTAIDHGTAISIQKRAGKTYTFAIDGKTCPGLSLFSDDGYHGTFGGKESPSWSAMFTDGEIIVANLAGRMWTGPVPEASQTGQCRELCLSPTGRDSDWVYAIAPLKDELLYGGTADERSCAPIVALDHEHACVDELHLPDCIPGLVTEIYSLGRWRQEFLIGTYPLGQLYALDPVARTLRRTDFGQALPNDVPNNGGLPYRESQSVLVSAGRVYIGMYPWSELFVHEHDNLTVSRIICEPEKTGCEMVPFDSIMTDVMLRSAGVDRLDQMTPKIGAELRSKGLHRVTWAQRIPTIAVMGGRICVSTGSMGGEYFDPHTHPIPASVAATYGEIFSASLENHTLGDVSSSIKQLRFTITQTEMLIAADDAVIARAAHRLSAEALRALAGATPRIGIGDYGPFRGSIDRKTTSS